jgi:hypothetical protein
MLCVINDLMINFCRFFHHSSTATGLLMQYLKGYLCKLWPLFGNRRGFKVQLATCKLISLFTWQYFTFTLSFKIENYHLHVMNLEASCYNTKSTYLCYSPSLKQFRAKFHFLNKSIMVSGNHKHKLNEKYSILLSKRKYMYISDY